MSHLWAVILGIVQGFTEFLPISSTAHLKIIPWVFQVHDAFLYSTQFDIALHAGSFVAILIALWTDWVDLGRKAVGGDSFSRKFIGFLVVTTIPAAIVGVLLDTKVERLSTPSNPAMPAADTFHYAPLLIGGCIIVFGVLLWAVDRFAPDADDLDQMTWARAALIGIAEALALVPGVSRSGATITAGRALALSREAIAKYSFMAALPIIGGAAVFGLRDVPLGELFSLDWVLGFAAAAIASVVAMRFLLKWLQTRSFAIFAIYRVVVGVLVIALFVVRG